MDWNKLISLQDNEKTCLISFSRGKDSIAVYLKCRDSGVFDKIYMYHYYLVPDLSFVNESLEYYKSKFNIEIINIPNWRLYKIFNDCSFFNPQRIYAYNDSIRDNVYLQDVDNQDMEYTIKLHCKISQNIYTAVGVKSSDSAMRRTNIIKYGHIREKSKKYYPIHDIKNTDIEEMLKKENIKLPDDYKLFGMTFDGLDYRFIKIIKDRLPEDYKKIQEMFPLIDMVIYRHEHYKNSIPKKGRWYGRE